VLCLQDGWREAADNVRAPERVAIFRAAVNPSMDAAGKTSLFCAPRPMATRSGPAGNMSSVDELGSLSSRGLEWQTEVDAAAARRVTPDVFSTRSVISSNRRNERPWVSRMPANAETSMARPDRRDDMDGRSSRQMSRRTDPMCYFCAAGRSAKARSRF
jgi:hypothetical protein